jgi:two-component system NarL family sensor kinase
MTLPLRMLFIAVLQVVLTSLLTYYLVTDEYRDLSSQSLDTLENFLIEQKHTELKNYTLLAVSAMTDAYQNSNSDDVEAKKRVTKIIHDMTYSGVDGYFFIYDGEGNGVVHPKEPYRVGENWWALEGENGEKTIQILIANAKAGGGFYRYLWRKPSANKMSEKMGYSVFLENWNWMIGTGVYLDDVNSQLSMLQQEIDQHINKTKQIILVVAMSSIFVIFLLGLILNLNHKKRTDQKISELGLKIINMQEEERRHISRELHDGIVQVLVSIKYSLEATGLWLKKSHLDKPQPLIQAQTNLHDAINEIRRISHHLHPRILDELGLSAAMDALAVDFSKQTGIKVNVTKPAVRKLVLDGVNTTLYRVVQETLINVQKHAHATEVNIELLIKNSWLTLIISDNGRGFNTQENKYDKGYGIGLRNLAERVEYHLGEFNVQSSKNGTLVTARIPKTSYANNQTTNKGASA